MNFGARQAGVFLGAVYVALSMVLFAALPTAAVMPPAEIVAVGESGEAESAEREDAGDDTATADGGEFPGAEGRVVQAEHGLRTGGDTRLDRLRARGPPVSSAIASSIAVHLG